MTLRQQVSWTRDGDTSVFVQPPKVERSESYLPYLWVLCALASALCLVATLKLVSSGVDLDAAMVPPAVGAMLFAALAALASPERQSD